MPAEISRLADFPTHGIMDFSRNSQGFNDQDDLSATVNGQDLLRRLAATRGAAGLMTQDSNAFGLGSRLPTLKNSLGGPGASAMFGQGVTPNQFAAAPASTPGGSNTSGPFSMMQNSDREEDLLLQLLLARRRRQDFQQGFPQQEADRSSSFTDELLRLRQAGNAAAASSAATAAMFAADQDPHQQFQQFQQQQQQGNMRGQGMFSQSTGGLNLPSGPPFMMQDQASGLRSSGINSNAFGEAGRRLDDYLLRTQHHHPQESILAVTNEQQRIELSPSRFLSLQHQSQATGFLDCGGMSGNKRGFGEDFRTTVGGDLEKMDKMEPPMKKKRFHKKKPSDMPRRPLSAYNLFFSEERERILKEIDAKDGDAEDKDVKDDTPSKEEEENSAEEDKKPRALLRPLLPSEKKRRPHRKTHGKISFRLLAQMVGQRWKALPVERRKYYQDLAKEDMARQKRAMEEYYLKQSEKVKNMDQQEEDKVVEGADHPVEVAVEADSN